MEKDENKSDVVEENNSEATEEIATPTPYKHPNRNLMDKDIETAATEESKEETDEKKPKEDRPVGVEDAVFKKRYDDLKRHYDETVSKHKDDLRKLKKEKEALASKPIFKSKEELEEWRKDYPDMYDSVMQMTTEATMKAKEEMNEELLKIIADLKDILQDKERRMEIIKSELLEIKEKYGDNRRSKIEYAGGNFRVEDMIPCLLYTSDAADE